MALVQFSGALVPQLGEKPRLLPGSPALARAAYAADARFLAPRNGYVCPRLGYCLVVLGSMCFALGGPWWNRWFVHCNSFLNFHISYQFLSSDQIF